MLSSLVAGCGRCVLMLCHHYVELAGTVTQQTNICILFFYVVFLKNVKSNNEISQYSLILIVQFRINYAVVRFVFNIWHYINLFNDKNKDTCYFCIITYKNRYKNLRLPENL